MLPRRHRLAAKKEVDLVFSRGEFFSCPEMTLKFLANKTGQTRATVLVGKKMAKLAVDRNRIKRRLRDVIEKNFDRIPVGTDLLILARTPKLAELDYQLLTEKVCNLISKISLSK